MGVSWNSLPVSVQRTFFDAIDLQVERNTWNRQEVSNTRYALALMAFDAEPLDARLISAFHLMNSVADKTEAIPGSYTVTNEFCGLKSGELPVDCVVYKDDKIVAFVEVDGLHHYLSNGQLTREGHLKTWLYEKNYPGVPLIRVKVVDFDELGVKQCVEKVVEDI
eukprot:gene42362-52534_t